MGPGDENAAIRACLQPDAVLFTLVEQAKDVMAAIRAEVEKHETKLKHCGWLMRWMSSVGTQST
jgi:hypothetical protein